MATPRLVVDDVLQVIAKGTGEPVNPRDRNGVALAQELE
jgi:hypothetical protein